MAEDRKKSPGWMRKAVYLALIAAAFFILSRMYALHSNRARNITSPNVVLITLDTTRADHIGSFGAPADRTPALDALAADGAVFTDATSASFGTTPSHTSILTSTYALQHGVYSNHTRFPQSAASLQEILRSNGYFTAAFVSAVPVSGALGFDRGFDLFNEWYDPDLQKVERRAEHTTDSVLKWLKKKPQAPFFLWVHYFDPHYFYLPPPEFRNLFGPADDILDRCEKERLDENVSDEEAFARRATRQKDSSLDKAYIAPRIGSEPGRACVLAGKDYNILQKSLYSGEIAYMDRQIGRLLERFRRKGLYGHTLFAVVADHGETLDEIGHVGNFRHGTVHEEIARVPLIFVLPEKHPKKIVSRAPVSTIDIMPTILDYLDIEIPDEFPASGVSILDIARGSEDPKAENRPIFFETAHKQGAGIKLRGLKYLQIYEPEAYFDTQKPQTSEQLFDLLRDPGERNNLAGSADYEIEKLKHLLDDWKKTTAGKALPRTPDDIQDKEILNRLKQLGYL